MHYAPADIAAFGTILGIWAHPDDEVFSSGGLMASAATNGQEIIVITATYGDAGETADDKRWPKRELAKIRTKELEASLEILGSIEHHWLGCIDGRLAETDSGECVQAIQTILENRQIDTVVTFEETGITGHPDHCVVHRWALDIARLVGAKQVLLATENKEFYEQYGKQLDMQFDVYFNVDEPKVVSCADADVCVRFDKTISEKKFNALQAHASQTAGLLESDFGIKAMQVLCQMECFERKHV